MHELILASIIFGAGVLSASANYFNAKSTSNNEAHFWKNLFTSVGASLLVPLLLNMLSSNLIKSTDKYDSINYFVFAGFCFVAGYYSDKFINTIGDKVLKDIANTKEKAQSALDKAEETKDKVDILISSETESDDEDEIVQNLKLEELTKISPFKDENLDKVLDDIIGSFNGKYKFRTIRGITKELNYPDYFVKAIIETLDKKGVVKKMLTQDNREVWGLTNLGTFMLNKDKSTSV